MNAVTFIRNSALYTSPKFAQLHSIMDKLLSDALASEDLAEFVNEIAPLDTAKLQEASRTPPAVKQNSMGQTLPDEPGKPKIIVIKEIQEANNIGLIGETPPIVLCQGLNVFYGHNASGKTSLYKAMSNCLGLTDHTIQNVNDEAAKPAYARLLVEDAEGNVYPLAWPSPETREQANVKCFDSSVSFSLVREPQQNTFALVHLKQEYFTRIGEAFEELAAQVEERRRRVAKRLDELTKMLQTSDPLFGEMLPTLTVEQVDNASISSEDREHLSNLQAKLAKLEKEDLADKVKTFANDVARIDEILSPIGTQLTSEERSGITWQLAYDAAYFEGLRKLINTFTQHDETLHKQASTISGFLPAGWAEEKLWLRFVHSALEFVHSRDLAERSEYSEQKCPYCQQELSPAAQELLAAYGALHGEVKKKRDESEREITKHLHAAQSAIEKLKQVSYKQSLISDETKTRAGDETFDLNRVLRTLTVFLDSLLHRAAFSLERGELENIKSFYDHYLNMRKAASEEKKSYETLSKDKGSEEKNLRTQITPLRQRQLLVDNRDSAKEYLLLRKMRSDITQVRALLTEAKRLISKMATEFSNQVTVREFQKFLDCEYDELGFQKPTRFRLTCKSAAGATKRVYSIADRGFHEILSEGEQKQHGLADFFAQIAAEGYTGLVIFDDPVTSLDECNIEKVARRIVRLSQEPDTQVILFTHNILFLNSLTEITGDDKVMHMSNIGGEITIHPEARLGNTADLKRRRRNIEKRIREMKLQAKVSEPEVRNVYDMLSSYIEAAVEVSLFKEVVGRYRPNIRIQSLRKIQWDNDAVHRLVELYNRTSRKGTRHSQPAPVPQPTTNELIRDSEDILSAVGDL